ncbi:DMT family transporter [Nonomuraea sp. B12E4]|uniref:DMT family transporter n=1 Tax=Nonomuraea sp. B12E4 TaxID=3153564 RepID=UPI00325CB81F
MAVEGDVPPLWVALGRCLFGAVTLWIVCLAQRVPAPSTRATWGHALVVAVLHNAVPFTLLAYGETQVSSVLAGVLNATTPLTTLGFSLLVVAGERPSLRRLAGLGVGFAGVLTTIEVWDGLGCGTLYGALACVGSTVCYGAGFAYTRRFFSGREGSAVSLIAVQLTCATGLLAVAAALGEAPVMPGVAGIGAVAVLGVLGTGIGFLLNFRVIREAGPTIAASVTYVAPVWSTLIGAVLLGEPLGWSLVGGGLLVVLGVLLIQARSRTSLLR